MSTVSPSQSNAGDLITAAAINNPVNQLAAVLNGGIDSTNLADSSVTAAKVAANLPTSKLQVPYKFNVYCTAAVTLASATWTKISFDTRLYDTGSNLDITTNKGRFTAPVAGFYVFSAAFSVNIGGAADLYSISLYKNGAEINRGVEASGGISFVSATVSPPPIQLAAGDYIEVFGFNSTGGAKSLNVGGSTLTYFGGFLISTT